MDYTKLVLKKKQYKYSVNICFDLRNEERLAGFIPNTTTTEILREYLGEMIRGNSGSHSKILYGSYGTGKSHLLTVMSAVLGHINLEGNGFRNFTSLLSKYDSELSEDIQKFAKEDKPFFVVPVYSDYDDFGKCISFSLKKELERNGIEATFRGFFDEALELIEKWEKGVDSSARLCEVCNDQGISINELRSGLSSYDNSYEEIFNVVYSGMSYGAVFNSTSGNLIDNMNIANEAIKNDFRGIVLIFDEFGRYVEDYGESIKVKSVQDIAEYCDHSDNNNYLILVSHKQLSLYTGTMKKSTSEEWKKVEGRFRETSINVKYDQCLSLIGNIIPKNDTHWQPFKKRFENELYELYTQAWDFKGFMLPPESEESNPFEDGYPLHPISLFALDRLSKKVAQNERTFFTYLAGDEDRSLFAQLEKLDVKEFHFVGLDSLYDYFEFNIKAFKTDESYEVYKKLQYALNKLGADDEGYQTKVLKTIAVISIISDTDVLIADRATLLCVIDGEKGAINDAIDSLEKKKIIKYMRQYGYYDYFDSSIFDLEEMIEEKIAGINDDMVVKILNERFADFALYPYRYNERYYINRVFVPAFATKGDLTKKSLYNNLPDHYDGAVVFVLDDQADEDEYVQLTGIPDRTLLVVNGKSKLIEEEVKRYISLQYYFSIKDELSKDDPSVVNELILYLNEQEAIVIELIRKWRSLGDRGTFILYDGRLINATSEETLSDVLSEIMESTYYFTPMIKNDLLNKNNISAAIKQARKKALENIMGKDDIYEGLSYLSPEFNVVRATLSKNGLIDNESISNAKNRIEKDQINCFPNGIPSCKPVMTAIQEKLCEAENARLAMQDLYGLLKSEPYGLRDGYIPVLISYALRDYQNVSLYFHGNEHSYCAEELVRALEEPENYTLFICNWDEEQTAYIEGLERLFFQFLPEGDGLNRLEELFKAINTHYSSISKSARTTDLYVSEIAKEYRDILSVSYKDYNAFFFEVLPRLNSDLQELVVQIAIIKGELEDVANRQFAQTLRVTKKVFGFDEHEDLMIQIRRKNSEEWANKSQKAFDYTTNNVLDVVNTCDDVDEKQFILDLAKAATGFELAYWSDQKINDYEETLNEVVNRLNDYDPEKGLSAGEVKITIESADGIPVTTQFSNDELSITGTMLLNKINSTLNDFGESISYEEKISIITEVMRNVIN